MDMIHQIDGFRRFDLPLVIRCHCVAQRFLHPLCQFPTGVGCGVKHLCAGVASIFKHILMDADQERSRCLVGDLDPVF